MKNNSDLFSAVNSWKSLKEKKICESVLNIREVKEVFDKGGEFYREIIKGEGGFYDFLKSVYLGIEHSPTLLSDKMPNITRFWNWPFKHGGGVFYASSLGHEHPPEDFAVQEIYEFWEYGGMLLRDLSDAGRERTKLFLCKPGDKVVVPPACIMTIFNFSYEELLTFDMANPEQNKSSKEILKEKQGPMLAMYNHRSPDRVVVKFNPKYFSNIGKYYLKDSLNFRVEPTRDGLYEKLLELQKEFEERGIEILKGNKVVECEGRDKRVYRLDKTLMELVAEETKPVHKLLGMI